MLFLHLQPPNVGVGLKDQLLTWAYGFVPSMVGGRQRLRVVYLIVF